MPHLFEKQTPTCAYLQCGQQETFQHPLHLCTSCYGARYCNRLCQIGDRDRHKKACMEKKMTREVTARGGRDGSPSSSLAPFPPLSELQAAAAAGDAAALDKLGVLHEFGRGGLKSDLLEAAKFYKRAVAAADPPPTAYYNLAQCYDLGRGVVYNPTEAAKWYRVGAEAGHMLAQYTYGLCLMDGLGVPTDVVGAYTWFKAAADGGLEQAETNVGNAYYTGVGVKLDEVKGVEYWQKAVAKGNANAMYNVCYGGVVGGVGRAVAGCKVFTRPPLPSTDCTGVPGGAGRLAAG